MNNNEQNLPQISVIMPVYNAQDTLRRAVDSVLAQTYENTELILIDDGSTDDSPAMTDEYAAADPDRIRVIHKKNGGLMRAWFDGVQISSGQILCFVDSDDWIDPEMISVMAEHLIRNEDGSYAPAQIVCCGYLIEYPGGKNKAVGHGLPKGVYESEKLQKELKRELLGHEQRRVILSRCMKLVSRELILSNTGYLDFSIHMGEDLNITVPALLDASRVVILQDPFYHYVFVPGSMIHRYDDALYDDSFRLRNILRNVCQQKLGLEPPNPADHEFLFFFLNVLKNEVRRTDGKDAAKKAIQRIQELCRKENSRLLAAEYPDRLRDPANRLLACICRKPSALRIRLIRVIFQFYERVR